MEKMVKRQPKEIAEIQVLLGHKDLLEHQEPQALAVRPELTVV
jgi:hypothetical protein